MQQLRTTLITAGFVLVGVISALNTFPAEASGSEPGPAISITGGDTESRSIVDEAIAQYIDFGLELPLLDINIHDKDLQFCHGHRAYWQRGEERDVIDMCFVDRFTMLHEVAHAWVNHNVSDQSQAAFLALTPNQVWHDDDVKYNQQGIEDAANTIARGLLPEPFTLDSDQDMADMDAFELLVGRPSPRLSL